MTAFSILKKMFLKIESLMCALRAHINRTQKQIYQEKHIHVHEFVIDTFCVGVYSYELMRFNI